MEVRGKNLEEVQAMNRKLLLKLLQQNVICSRAYLSGKSGLKQATITNIVNDFIAWGLVEEKRTENTGCTSAPDEVVWALCVTWRGWEG